VILTPKNATRQDWRGRACELVNTSIEAERTFLVSAWYHPKTGYEAAIKTKLNGSDFVLNENSALFAFVMVCAERGLVPCRDTFIQACRYACPPTTWDMHCKAGRWRDGALELLDMLLGTDFNQNAIQHYAECVKMFSDRRREASDCMRRAAELLGGRARTKELNAPRMKRNKKRNGVRYVA
jgi:hypothetical protein